MKFIAKFLLTAIAVPVFIILVLSINIRFQFLSSKFWTDTLEKGNVYAKISSVISDNLESKVIAEGGGKSDVAVLTNLISPLNVKDFAQNNIQSVISYANGREPELAIYTPSLKPSDKPVPLEKVSFAQFAKDYNVSGVTQKDLEVLAKFGFWSWLLFGASIVLIILISVFLYLLAPHGKHLGGMGTVFVLSSVVMAGCYFFLNYAAGLLTDNFAGSSNIATAFGAVIAPPVIGEIIKVWALFSVLTFVLGILLFFVKKPAKTN